MATSTASVDLSVGKVFVGVDGLKVLIVIRIRMADTVNTDPLHNGNVLIQPVVERCMAELMVRRVVYTAVAPLALRWVVYVDEVV